MRSYILIMITSLFIVNISGCIIKSPYPVQGKVQKVDSRLFGTWSEKSSGGEIVIKKKDAFNYEILSRTKKGAEIFSAYIVLENGRKIVNFFQTHEISNAGKVKIFSEKEYLIFPVIVKNKSIELAIFDSKTFGNGDVSKLNIRSTSEFNKKFSKQVLNKKYVDEEYNQKYSLVSRFNEFDSSSTDVNSPALCDYSSVRKTVSENGRKKIVYKKRNCYWNSAKPFDLLVKAAFQGEKIENLYSPDFMRVYLSYVNRYSNNCSKYLPNSAVTYQFRVTKMKKNNWGPALYDGGYLLPERHMEKRFHYYYERFDHWRKGKDPYIRAVSTFFEREGCDSPEMKQFANNLLPLAERRYSRIAAFKKPFEDAIKKILPKSKDTSSTDRTQHFADKQGSYEKPSLTRTHRRNHPSNGVPHRLNKKIISSKGKDYWKPKSGYVWVDPENSDEVIWKSGISHKWAPNVISKHIEPVWTTAPGYVWRDKESSWDVIWSPGLVHTSYKHVIADIIEGKWALEPGYSSKIGRANDVTWTPGLPYSEKHPGVRSGKKEGDWEPAIGYSWVNKNKMLVKWSSGAVYPGLHGVVSTATIGEWRVEGRIGVNIVANSKYPEITSVRVGSPAEKIGLMKGMKILEIDGKTTRSMSSKSVVNLLRGSSGTKVRLVCLEPTSNTTRTYSVKRYTYTTKF